MTSPSPSALPRRPPPPRRSGLVLVGAIVLAILDTLVAWLASGPDGLESRGSTYDIGYLIGGLAGAGFVMAAAVLIVYGIVRLVRRGKTAAPLRTVALWTLLVLLFVEVANLVGGTSATGASKAAVAVSDSERNGLSVSPDSLRHQLFGFALPNPGPDFHAAADLQQTLNAQVAKRNDMVGWGLRGGTDQDPEVLIVQVTKFPRLDEAHFRAFLKGMREGLGRSEKTRVLTDSAVWADSIGDYRVALQHENGTYLKLRCVGRTPRPTPLIVCIETATHEADGLDFVREGLAFSP